MEATPWTAQERQTILDACKSGETSFDVGNLRWEATVQDLQRQLLEAKTVNPEISQAIKQLSGMAGRCLHMVSQGLRDPASKKSMKKALDRIAAEIRRTTAKTKEVENKI